MTEVPFKKDEILVRKRIHDLVGGNREKGISTPANHPIILLFSTRRGQEYGYQDYWEGNVFHYAGEGRIGDMQFTMGNKAVRDHQSRGERLLLFEEVDERRYKFTGEMLLKGWRFEPMQDLRRNVRKGIVFELVHA